MQTGFRINPAGGFRSKKSDGGGAPSSGLCGRISVGGDEGGPRENRANDFALDSDSAAVDDAESLESKAVGFGEILFDHGRDVARRNAVQVKNVGDGNANGLVRRTVVHGRK
jgi:hypothetical protein